MEILKSSGLPRLLKQLVTGTGPGLDLVKEGDRAVVFSLGLGGFCYAERLGSEWACLGGRE